MTELKNKKLEKYCTPNYMWVTFDKGQGQHACIKKKEFEFGSYKFKLKRAQNPTDFMFQNCKMDTDDFKARKRWAKLVVLVFGIAFFICGTILIKRMQIINFMQQPPLVSCPNLKKRYHEEELFSLAFQEFLSLKTHIDEDSLNINAVVSRSGALYCFCEEHIKDGGESLDTVYKLSYSDPSIFDINKFSQYEAPICKRYYKYMTGFGYILSQVFAYLIVGASYAFRTGFIYMAEKMRFTSLT